MRVDLGGVSVHLLFLNWEYRGSCIPNRASRMRRWKVYAEELYNTSSIISWNSSALFGRIKFFPDVSSSSKNFVFTPFCILCVTMATKHWNVQSHNWASYLTAKYGMLQPHSKALRDWPGNKVQLCTSQDQKAHHHSLQERIRTDG